MKRLELTPQLISLIKSRVGEDVELDGIAVFEAITLNTKPLPGKRGTWQENARATALTLRQISDHIQSGGSAPLMMLHDMGEMPRGRVFDAGLNYGDDGEFELRTLFYLDKTEADLAAKIDAGSIDEVSISFLPTAYLCSECGWDYLGDDASPMNRWDRTCANGHVVGTDGVHLTMVGLAQLLEVSLVARGAADNPKIVGRSASKLTTAPAQRLAARGFEIDGLVCQASRGEYHVDTAKLTADLITASTKVGVLEAAAAQHDAALAAAHSARDDALAQVTTLTAKVEELTTQLTAAQTESKVEDAAAAVTYLTSVLTKLCTAAGEAEPAGEMTVDELTAAIDAKTQGLTALIPAGGAAVAAGADTDTENKRADLSAFKTRR